MIYGTVKGDFFEEQLAVLPEILRKVLRFLKTEDLAGYEPGRSTIDLDGTSLILQVLDLETADRESLRPEIHRKTIDVQFLAAGGPEKMGFYPELGEGETDEDLLETERDILFYSSASGAGAEGRAVMTAGDYIMFFPWDVHIPAISTAAGKKSIRKIVVKVPLEAVLQRK